jgi:dihydrodipicolinate synthase/N-acetylneuraminate lyase
VGVLPGEKEIMNLMGLDFGRCRKPFKPISEEERAMLKNALDALNKS